MPPKQKALEKQELLEAARSQKAAEEAERQEAATWSVGAKSGGKQQENEEKDAAKRAKAAEKAALLAADEASVAGVVKVGKPKKSKKDTDFDLLNAALKNQPKTKAQKEAEAKKAADDERKKKEAEAREAKEARLKAEQDYINKQAARGIIVNHTDDLFIPLNNRLEEEDDEDYEDQGTGLDAAVDVLHIATKGQSSADEHPERRRKALYNAYYERELASMKEDYPMLKLSQYKDRIFEAWKKSPENPANQKA